MGDVDTSGVRWVAWLPSSWWTVRAERNLRKIRSVGICSTALVYDVRRSHDFGVCRNLIKHLCLADARLAEGREVR